VNEVAVAETEVVARPPLFSALMWQALKEKK
jgi:hypothetical protein